MEIVLCDFEFETGAGERPTPVCMVAYELKSGRRHRLMPLPASPPFPIDANTIFVAYLASAELGCFRVLGWPMPKHVLDLYVEFRHLTNGLSVNSKLIGALSFFGLDHIGATEKREMQEAIGTGTWRGRYTETEVLDYCQTDVDALARLLPVMLPGIDLPRALLRGRYMTAVSAMEHNGVPIDVPMLERLRAGWHGMQDALIADIDADYGVFDGRTFKQDRFAAFLQRAGIPWPRLESGQLDLSDDTFRQQAKAYPLIAPLRELRAELSDFRLNNLAVGRDGRNRCMLSPFRARSGRNQPSNAEFIFGPSVCWRGLIKPPPGYAVAYIDWAQQEFGIAAALSGDANMQRAYRSGDPYLSFAKLAGAVPECATKESHQAERELYKQTTLATAYGMQAESLALRIGQPVIVARDLLRAHREAYPVFWRWSDAAVNQAMLTSKLTATFGWTIHVGTESNPRSLRNFPCQANGAEMLRLACCLATERGIQVCAPVHDAILICAPLDRIEADVAATRHAMAEASTAVLPGFPLETDVKIVRYPDRYMDRRGTVMWRKVIGLLDRPSLQVVA
jgi:hypothetical protein